MRKAKLRNVLPSLDAFVTIVSLCVALELAFQPVTAIGSFAFLWVYLWADSHPFERVRDRVERAGFVAR